MRIGFDQETIQGQIMTETNQNTMLKKCLRN